MQHRRYFVETEGNETERVRKKRNEMEQSSYLLETERNGKNDTNHSPNLFHSVSFRSVSFRFGIKNSWPPLLRGASQGCPRCHGPEAGLGALTSHVMLHPEFAAPTGHLIS